MTGWRLAIGFLVAFGLGWVVASWRALIRHEEAAAVLYQLAEANQDHALCKLIQERMDDYIAHQEAQLDAYAAGDSVADGAEAWMRGETGP